MVAFHFKLLAEFKTNYILNMACNITKIQAMFNNLNKIS